MRNKRLKDRRNGNDKGPDVSMIVTLIAVSALMLGAFFSIMNNKIAPDDSNKWVEWIR